MQEIQILFFNYDWSSHSTIKSKAWHGGLDGQDSRKAHCPQALIAARKQECTKLIKMCDKKD